ncbi:AAA domain-containing protein [Neobacillus sp. PS3-34]|uniref:AAA domain-containing protein n=1 Tax=Neobacillus sp. PS3-34 TaxID=3070678 RepID=UPI0027DEE034|nr:AAA domain-containing protein [Neobacillus sp. PS3-34]WML50716.1 AAA domain-containing protein [Neobacillus sp. PS3-34]
MHPEISAFTNQYIYQSLVGDHESVGNSRNEIVSRRPFPNRAAILLDTSFTGDHCINEPTSNSRLNPWQLFLSFQLIHEAYLGGSQSIGYVTPYRAQANLMELLLEDLYEKKCTAADIISATVHKFQGSERDVMIFDTVDGEPQHRAGMLLTGKDSERLINVAITRTRGKFIHVSNRSYISKHVYQGKTLRQLVQHQENHKQTVSPTEIGKWIKNQHPRLQWIHALKLERIFNDLQSARSSIVISLPDGTVMKEQWKEMLKSRDKRVRLMVISGENWHELEPYQRLDFSLPFPFIIIDQQLFWLGLPLEGVKGVRPPYIAARLDSEKVCEYFIGQFLAGE